MKRAIRLIPAPTGIQPGGYVRVAYADRNVALIPEAEISVQSAASGWSIALSWACPEPQRSAGGETDRFVDACAVLAPLERDAPWVTMGAPESPLEGFLWRADRPKPWHIESRGLGTVRRTAAIGAIAATGEWQRGRWNVAFDIPDWPALTRERQLALAVWCGFDQERGGLKSISPGWLSLDSSA